MKKITTSFWLFMKNNVNKPTLVLCIALFGILPNAKAQSDSENPLISMGLKAGTNYSNVWDSKGEDFRADSKFGFAGGFFVGISLGELIGFQPEILISQKGFKGSGKLLGENYTFSRTTTFIDIPLQLQIKPSPNLTLLAGPQYSYLLRKKDTYSYGVNSVEQAQEFKNDNIRENIFGFIFGADVTIEQYVLSAKLGLDLQSNNGDGTANTPRYKNRWVQFTVGYRLTD